MGDPTEQTINGVKAPPRPYATGVPIYITLGWSAVLPLPKRQKASPPTGFTGHRAELPTELQLRDWTHTKAEGNICLRMVDGIIGLDVDHYDEKHGADQLAGLESTLGELPETWISTSRDDGVSGIRFYRTPEGLRWKGNAAKDIEVIQGGHRYAVVWPSIHPNGGLYQWLDPDGYPATQLPRP